jgi:uncharacterized membrane protein YadS
LDQTVKITESARGRAAKIGALAPGLAIAGTVAFAASRMTAWETAVAQAWFGRPIAVAAPVIALLLGVVFHAAAARPSVMPGLTFAIKRVLRWAIALFGLNIALSDIIGLGVGTAAMVIVAMAATLISGLLFARLFGKGDPYGVLAGAACAVCGASAALATSTVLPPSAHRESDTAFVVITTNLLATFAILAYPPIWPRSGSTIAPPAFFLGHRSTT